MKALEFERFPLPKKEPKPRSNGHKIRAAGLGPGQRKRIKTIAKEKGK